MKTTLLAVFACLALIAPGAGFAADKKLKGIESARAAQTNSAENPAKKARKQAKKQTKTSGEASGGRVAKFDPGSEESKGQRQSRLRAECKGKVNAGACEGLTR